MLIPFVAVVDVHNVTAVQNLDGRVNAKNGDSLGDRTVIWHLQRYLEKFNQKLMKP